MCVIEVTLFLDNTHKALNSNIFKAMFNQNIMSSQSLESSFKEQVDTRLRNAGYFQRFIRVADKVALAVSEHHEGLNFEGILKHTHPVRYHLSLILQCILLTPSLLTTQERNVYEKAVHDLEQMGFICQGNGSETYISRQPTRRHAA